MCEILGGVVRAIGVEVTRRQGLGFGLRGAKGLCISPQGPVRLINKAVWTTWTTKLQRDVTCLDTLSGQY